MGCTLARQAENNSDNGSIEGSTAGISSASQGRSSSANVTSGTNVNGRRRSSSSSRNSAPHVNLGSTNSCLTAYNNLKDGSGGSATGNPPAVAATGNQNNRDSITSGAFQSVDDPKDWASDPSEARLNPGIAAEAGGPGRAVAGTGVDTVDGHGCGEVPGMVGLSRAIAGPWADVTMKTGRAPPNRLDPGLVGAVASSGLQPSQRRLAAGGPGSPALIARAAEPALKRSLGSPNRASSGCLHVDNIITTDQQPAPRGYLGKRQPALLGKQAAGSPGSPPSSATTASSVSGGASSPSTQAQQSAIDPGMFIQKGHAHLSDRYVRERKLGSGAYGEVLLCRDKQTGAERAVKIIKKSSVTTTSSTSLLEEVAVVKQLDHPNIMKLYEFFEDRRNYYLVSEVYKGGELFDEIINRQRFTEVDAATTMKQVLSGVTYLHRYQIVHRDLKPENLLLESKAKDSLIKIVDFGLSSSFDPKKKMKDRLGTAYYIAPEVLKQKYDEKCDVWSCGVILFILLCGYPPFSGNTDKEILYRVGKGKFSFDPPEWSNISSEVKDLITKMLTFDPAKRISAEGCLQHPWIQKVASQDSNNVIKAPVLFNALGNMRKFQASQKLAQAALLFIGSKLTTMEETRELTQIFRKLDTNGDGQLDRKELIQGYERLVRLKGGNISGNFERQQIEEEVDKILESVDFDRNGFIEYSEFVTVAMDKKILLSRARLQAAFSMFDQDSSGTIAADELRRILGEVDESQWISIIQEVDTNNDGEIDFDEFVQMMQRLWLDRSDDDPVQSSPRDVTSARTSPLSSQQSEEK